MVLDMLNIKEVKGEVKGLKLTYGGDGNNVCNSLLLGGALEGMSIYVACPAGYEPNATILREAEKTSRTAGGNIDVSHDPLEAARDADLLYTDVLVSMGDAASKEKIMKDFNGYQIN